MTRRELFVRGACAAGAAAVGALGVERLTADPPGGKPARIRFGLTTYQWGQDWDIPALIANCTKAGALGVELRTSAHYAHGVEIDLGESRRREVRKQFADSPVTLVGLASSERFDMPDAAKLAAAIECTKQHLKLSHDLGASGVRVFPNDYQKGIPHEQTIAQIAKALNAAGAYAAELGQQVRYEAHGSAGDLPSIRAVMDQVTQRSVRVKLNCDKRDAAGRGFEYNFNLVKHLLGDTIHTHDFNAPEFPYQLQMDLLVKMGWSGWLLLEATMKVPDRVRAMQQQREAMERMIARSQGH